MNTITKTTTRISFEIQDVNHTDGFLEMTIGIDADGNGSAEEHELTVPVEDLGDDEWTAIEGDAESLGLEAVSAKLGIDTGRLLTALTRIGFEAWVTEGWPTDYAVDPGAGCSVEVEVDPAKAAAWLASATA